MIQFNREQKGFINSLGIKANKLLYSDDDLIEIEEKVSEKLQTDGFDQNYNITDIGRMCEAILDKLSKI